MNRQLKRWLSRLSSPKQYQDILEIIKKETQGAEVWEFTLGDLHYGIISGYPDFETRVLAVWNDKTKYNIDVKLSSILLMFQAREQDRKTYKNL